MPKVHCTKYQVQAIDFPVRYLSLVLARGYPAETDAFKNMQHTITLEFCPQQTSIFALNYSGIEKTVTFMRIPGKRNKFGDPSTKK